MPERLIGFLFKLTSDKIRSVSCMKDSVSVGSIASYSTSCGDNFCMFFPSLSPRMLRVPYTAAFHMYQNVHKHPFSDVKITVLYDVTSCSLWLQWCDSVTHTKRILYSRFGQARFLPNPSHFIILTTYKLTFGLAAMIPTAYTAWCFVCCPVDSVQVLRFSYQQQSDTNCIFNQIK